jgi:hypothetical protein
MQDSLQNTLASHDSPPSPYEGVPLTMDTSTNDTNDDTHKEEEEYAKVIEDFFHLPQRDDENNLIQNWHIQNCMTIVMAAPCQHYFCYSICRPNMVGVKPKLN